MADLKFTKPTDITPFKRCVLQNFPFIEEDFDALTNYGLLCKVVEYLNKVIEQQNLVNADVTELNTAFVTLKNYVDNYFASTDFQKMIDNKLDEMAESGELELVIEKYVAEYTPRMFDNVENMKKEALSDGNYAQTIGYYSANDGGGAMYQVTETEPTSGYYETLNNGNYAILIKDDIVNAKQLGAKGDGTTDDSTAISKYSGPLLLKDGTYVIGTALNIDSLDLIGNNAVLKVDNTITIKNLKLKDLEVTGSATTLFNFVGTNCSIDTDNCYLHSTSNYCFYSYPVDTTYSNFDDVKLIDSQFKEFTISSCRLIASADSLIADRCTFNNIGNSSSTRTSGINIGHSTDDTIYCKDFKVTNCTFEDLTSADSTGSDTSECQAIKVRIYSGIITNNIVKNINGSGEDHEGIYVKNCNLGGYVNISDNTLINCGAGNGAVTLKPCDGVVANNNISSNGTCLYLRGNIEASGNNIVQDSTLSSIYAITLTEANVKLTNNKIKATNSSGIIKLEYNGNDITDNIFDISANCYIITATNNASGTTNIKGNSFNLTNTSYLVRLVSVVDDYVTNIEDNKINGSFAGLINLNSALSTIAYEFNITNNIIDLSNYTASYIIDEYSGSSNASLVFDNNKINGNVDNMARCLFNTSIKNNTFDNISTLIRLNASVSNIEIINNIIPVSTIILRVSSSGLEADIVKIIGNEAIACTNVISTNTLTATNGYILNNMTKTAYDSSKLTATNSYVVNNHYISE